MTLQARRPDVPPGGNRNGISRATYAEAGTHDSTVLWCRSARLSRSGFADRTLPPPQLLLSGPSQSLRGSNRRTAGHARVTLIPDELDAYNGSKHVPDTD